VRAGRSRIVGVGDLRQQQCDRQAVSLQLPHRAAVYRQAGKGPQMAWPCVQAGRHRGRSTGIHAAMGSLHEIEPVMLANPEDQLMSEARAVDDALFVEIQRFLYREAGLLDRRDYVGWLALLAQDIRYRVSAAVARDAGVEPVSYAIIDEGLTGLKSRIDQI